MTTYAQAVNVSEPRGTEVTSAAVGARFSAIHGRLETANQVGRTVKDTWVIDLQVSAYPSSLKSQSLWRYLSRIINNAISRVLCLLFAIVEMKKF